MRMQVELWLSGEVNTRIYNAVTKIEYDTNELIIRNGKRKHRYQIEEIKALKIEPRF